MFSKALSASVVALAATQLVSAQTFTDCDPTKKDNCPDNEALGGVVEIDFTKGENDFFKLADGTSLTYDDELGAVFSIEKEGQAPTIMGTKYIFFGRVELVLRACTGQGVVTSSVLQSADLDEIDWEWLGGDTTQVQTNYFGKGDTTTYDRGAYHSVSTPQDTFHNYTIDWTKDYVKWYIDGSLVRTLLYADAQGGDRFPQTPMEVKLGTWVAGGKDAAKGTVEWAGGYTNFDSAPFLAYYKYIKITDYSNGVKGATSYSYNGLSDGSYQSIKVLTDGKESTTSDSSSTATKSSSSAKTTMSTATSASPITQATEGAESNSTTSASTTSSSSSSSTTNTASETSIPASSAFKAASMDSFVIMAAGLVLGFLVL